MILTLLWLTVSTPFVQEIQKKLTHKQLSIHTGGDESQNVEDSNPYSGLNEEKCSNSNTLSEYLHEPLTLMVLKQPELIHSAYHGPSIYIAYYGELISPPPEI